MNPDLEAETERLTQATLDLAQDAIRYVCDMTGARRLPIEILLPVVVEMLCAMAQTSAEMGVITAPMREVVLSRLQLIKDLIAGAAETR